VGVDGRSVLRYIAHILTLAGLQESRGTRVLSQVIFAFRHAFPGSPICGTISSPSLTPYLPSGVASFLQFLLRPIPHLRASLAESVSTAGHSYSLSCSAVSPLILCQSMDSFLSVFVLHFTLALLPTVSRASLYFSVRLCRLSVVDSRPTMFLILCLAYRSPSEAVLHSFLA
jgi:hypothetical protein